MGEKADRGLVETMLQRATATAGGFTTPQDIGNVLWALATMGERMDGAHVNLIDCLAGSTRVYPGNHSLSNPLKGDCMVMST